MDSEQKIEERKKWNAPFLRAFNYLLDVLMLRKGELCALIGIEPGLISRYNNGTKKVSVDTMNALIRASKGELNINYMTGKSEYMLLENVPDDEIINMHNPDHEVIEKRKSEKARKSSTNNSELLAAKEETINTLKERISDLQHTISDKDEIIFQLRKEISELYRKLNAGVGINYTFPIGVAEEKKARK